MPNRHAAMRLVLRIAVATCLLCAPHSALAEECAPHWVTGFGSPFDEGVPQPDPGDVFALARFDDGAGDALYIAGAFEGFGTVFAHRVAKWDGETLSPLGSGLNGEAYALCVFDDGMGGGPALYIGGAFTTAGGADAFRIARWRDDAWESVGDGFDGDVRALCVVDDGEGNAALYAGGAFTMSGETSTPRIARWNGLSWEPVGDGFDGVVLSMAAYDDGAVGGPTLYAGGSFAASGAIPVLNIARWNGAFWLPVMGGTNGAVRTMTVHDDGAGGGPELYVGGEFLNAGGSTLVRVAKWNGAVWTGVGGGVFGDVFALASVDEGEGGSALYFGGLFDAVLELEVRNIVRWKNGAWSTLDAGLNDAVYTLLGGDGVLYAGGAFTSAGGTDVPRVAQWNGVTWAPLFTPPEPEHTDARGGADPPLGPNSYVFALCSFDDGTGAGPSLYVGGTFTLAGAVEVSHVARWDGVAWHDVGGGLNGGINSFVVFDDGLGGGPALYAGGWFADEGDGTPNRVAKWDGTSWTSVGAGMDDEVYTLIVHNDGSGDALYAGGSFTEADEQPCLFIAKWDGESWTPVGGGTNGEVRALASFQGSLYAGGWFLTAGGTTARYFAYWDGSEWAAPSDAPDSGVMSLRVYDEGGAAPPALYVAGQFHNIGSLVTRFIARWTGDAWEGINPSYTGSGTVLALSAFDDGSGAGSALYVGGSFNTIGGTTSQFLVRLDGAQWSSIGQPNSSVFAMTPFDDGSGVSLFLGGSFNAVGIVPSRHFAKRQGCLTSCPGDTNGDGVVDFADFSLVLAHYGAACR